MITDQDITKLKTVFATKEDLAKVMATSATKEDISKLIHNSATKRELQDVKTELKADINILKKDMVEVKTDIHVLKEGMIEVKTDIHVLKNDMGEVKEDMAAMKETTQAIFVAIDGLAKSFDTLSHEYVALKHSDDRQNRQIKQLADHVDVKLID